MSRRGRWHGRYAPPEISRLLYRYGRWKLANELPPLVLVADMSLELRIPLSLLSIHRRPVALLVRVIVRIALDVAHLLHPIHLLLVPLIQRQSLDFTDVSTHLAMDASTLYAEEDAQGVRGPSRVAPFAVGAYIVAWLADEVEDLPLIALRCRLCVHLREKEGGGGGSCVGKCKEG